MPSFSFVTRSAAVLSVMLFPLSAQVMGADDAAHRLADKFSAAADAERRIADDAERGRIEDAERRKAEEAEMLERARQEAADRAEALRAAETAADARMRELEATRQAEAERLSEKLRRAEEARRAKAANETRRTFKPALSEPPLAKSVEAERGSPVAAPPVGREELVRNPDDRIAREPLPESSTDLRQSPPHVAGTPPMSLGRPGIDVETAEAAGRRVTVLLVMEPGRKGIRRFNKSADPVLCHNALCFVSKGATAPARVMTRRKALGAGNTLGKRAGACRHRLTCAFRGVELDGAAPVIQPVDLKILAHDRREPRSVSGDTSCHVTAGRLSCGRTVVAAGYRAWIVPESVAERAGHAALEAALARGLVSVDLREATVRD